MKGMRRWGKKEQEKKAEVWEEGPEQRVERRSSSKKEDGERKSDK
jgi:predicted Fe-S protein YdhL (DUF1289 family)